jgi:hypothetical protein
LITNFSKKIKGRSPEKDHRVQIIVFKNLRIYYYKKVKMADNLGLNGLVVSARKCAASMAAENRTTCGK